MNKLFGVLGLMMMAGSVPAFAQNVGVGYKADGSDVSGDFSEAEGDGASVSADVTVGFNIGKKIAIAIKGADGSFTTNPLFHPTTGEFNPAVQPASVLFLDNPDLSQHNATLSNITKSFLGIQGAIYSNTTVAVTIDPAKEFINENDPTSKVGAWHQITLRPRSGGGDLKINVFDDNDSSTSVFPITQNVGVSEFSNNGGVLALTLNTFLYRDTIDATDRSGNYYASTTITVTAM